ncbi:MAG: multicopper oxidase domain-containing protein [Bacteroidota bacterium]
MDTKLKSKIRFKSLLTLLFITFYATVFTQNQLIIPPSLTGLNFNLNVQSGFTNFYANPTPTYGINGTLLSPTIIVNKGDVVTLNVINGLTVNTTMHWHGLHVAPENDGGPHQNILAGTTWSPSFEILNNASTFWYHPHGHGKTELHVSKGLAGMFIIHDPAELSLGLPQTYGVDDIPLIVQSKAFDVLQQIAIADHMDTAVFVNGTLKPFVNLPAQVIRLRLLNGSSMRSFYFGFSNNMTFHQIATDGGLIQNALPLTRLLLAPGERAEILVDLTTMLGQDFDLMSYASEMPIGIFGSPSVGVAPDTMEMYDENFLNGNDYKLLDIGIVAQTANPITTLPTSLVPYTPFNAIDVDVNRRIVFDTITLFPGSVPNLAEGPFGMNNTTFNMDTINEIVQLNATEIWTLVNNTHIAHPFHIHDIEFNIIEKSGTTPPINEQGWKDVVLVMPHDSVKFITKFTTFSDEMVPYMYHCHLLHHEDDGMMGSFLVLDSTASIKQIKLDDFISVFPNPSNDNWNLKANWNSSNIKIVLSDISGKSIFQKNIVAIQNKELISIPNTSLEKGIYFLEINYGLDKQVIQLIKN